MKIYVNLFKIMDSVYILSLSYNKKNDKNKRKFILVIKIKYSNNIKITKRLLYVYLK